MSNFSGNSQLESDGECQNHGIISNSSKAQALDVHGVSANIYIGTAGYSYSHWRNGKFYPPTVTQSQELKYYSGVFPVVEINASFHAVPREETLQNWNAMAKDGFQFSFKVPQNITHYKRLHEIQDSLDYFLNRLLTMKNGRSSSRLGPILFQLPPTLQKNLSKLDYIAQLVESISESEHHQPPPYNNTVDNSTNDSRRVANERRGGLMIAFEFRHASWYCLEVYRKLRQYGFGLCENISPDNSTLLCRDISVKVTAGTWHYIRFHKRGDQLVTNYSDEQLLQIADELHQRRQQGIEQYCFFLNDHDGNGPKNAKTLMAMIKDLSKKSNNNKTSTTSSRQPIPPFVKHWKPDPAPKTIQSLFQKASAAAAAAAVTTTSELATPTRYNNFSSTSRFQSIAVASKSKSTPEKSIASYFSSSPSRKAAAASAATANQSATTRTMTGTARKSTSSSSTTTTPNKKMKKGTIDSFFSKK